MQFNIASKILIGLGSALFVIFSLLGFGGGFRFITGMELTKLKTLQQGSSTYEKWEKPLSPTYIGFYFFNLTNPQEFSNGAKAILREMGPYIYREDSLRQDVTLDSENGTLRYRMTKTYFFDQELTDGSETDRISIANVVFIASAAMAQEFVKEPYLLEQLDKILANKGEKLVITATVRQLLFDGVPLGSFMDIFNSPAMKQTAEDIGMELPPDVKDGKFALMRNKNGTGDGWFTIKTGQNDFMEVGQMVMYNDKPELGFWSDTCNDLKGTDGSSFPPYATKETIMEIFAPGMCRSYNMLYYKDSKVLGCETLQFVMDQETWKAPKSNPKNSCFCPTTKKVQQNCDKDGILNVSPCSDGAPLLLSQPHFLGAEETLLQSVEGLEPNFDKHVTMIDFEPLTGSPLRSVNRMQYNVEVSPHKDMPTFAKVKQAILPFVWVEETTTVGKQELGGLSSIILMETVFSVIHFAFMGVGALLVGQGLFLATRNKRDATPVKPFNNGDISKGGVSAITSESAFTY